jgi:FkbM family methyltransferase
VRWIRTSIDQNVFSSPVRVVEAAVGEASGRVSFHANGPWGHVESTDIRPGTSNVEMMTFPSLLASVGWDAPDFIKMDVEGSEGGVLRGAHSWFSAGHRPVILYEANGHMLQRFGDSPLTLRRFLAVLGYYQYELQDDGVMRVPSRFEPRVVVDYVATPSPVRDVLPPRSPWKVMRRTAAAVRRNSWPARIHVLRALREAVLSRGMRSRTGSA